MTQPLSVLGVILALLLGSVGVQAFTVIEPGPELADEPLVVIDHDAEVDTLPENRMISVSPVRHTMSQKARKIDDHVSSGELHLPDGRAVRVYDLDEANGVVVGGVGMSGITIDTVSPVSSGREALVLFVDREGKAYRPPAPDVGVWNADLKWLGYAYAEVPQHAVQLHLTLAIDKSLSMIGVMDKVKRQAKAFIANIPQPQHSQCSIVSFNRLVKLHGGVSFEYVMQKGHRMYDEQVRDSGTEDARKDFAKEYPEAILTMEDRGNRDKLKALVMAGNWGLPCARAGRLVDEIGRASGGTDLMTPVSVILETAAVIHSVPAGQRVKPVIVLISDGTDSENAAVDMTRLRQLKAETGATLFMYWPSGERDRSTLRDLIDFEMASEVESQAAVEAFLQSITAWLNGKQVLTIQP